MDRVYIGFDPAHPEAFAVCRDSVRRVWNGPIHGIWRAPLEDAGLYRRPTIINDGQLWDVISNAPMATEFAIARFFAPYLCGYEGFALFMDCDMLLSEDAPLKSLFLEAKRDTNKPVWCVKHRHEAPIAGNIGKMDGKAQTYYARKNWSSFMLINCAHVFIKEGFSLDRLNSQPGRVLHAFDGLAGEMIGELDPGWNWLVGVQPKPAPLYNTHHTLGGPWLDQFKDAPDADLWHKAYAEWIGEKSHDDNY